MTTLSKQLEKLGAEMQELKLKETRMPYMSETCREAIRQRICSINRLILDATSRANKEHSYDKQELSRSSGTELEFEESNEPEILVANRCEQCNETYKPLSCIEGKHCSPKQLVRPKLFYGPISQGDTWIINPPKPSQGYKKDIILNVFEVTTDHLEESYINEFREGIITQSLTVEETVEPEQEGDEETIREVLAYSESNIHDYATKININRKGVPYALRENPANRPNRNSDFTLLNEARSTGSLVKKIATDTCNIYEYHYQQEGETHITKLRMVEPSIQCILKNAYHLEGKELEVIKGAFIIVRRLQKAQASGDPLYFAEPVYVQIEEQKPVKKAGERRSIEEKSDSTRVEKIVKNKEKTQLVHVFYLSKPKKDHTFSIRAVLAKTKDIHRVSCAILEEQIFEHMYSAQIQHVKVLDRRIGLKIRVDVNGEIEEYKEYVMKHTVLRAVVDVEVLKQGTCKAVRYKHKLKGNRDVSGDKNDAIYEVKLAQICKNGMGYRKELMPKTGDNLGEELIEPSLEILLRFVKGALSLGDREVVKRDSLVLNKRTFIELTSMEELRFFYKCSMAIWKEDDVGERFDEKNISRIVQATCVLDKETASSHVDDELLPNKDECKQLKEVKGIYLLQGDTDNGKIDFHPDISIQDTLNMPKLNHKQGPTTDIMKTLVSTCNGSIMTEIELKAQLIAESNNKHNNMENLLKFPEEPFEPGPESAVLNCPELLNFSFKVEVGKNYVKMSLLAHIEKMEAILVEVEEPNVSAIIPHRFYHCSVEKLMTSCPYGVWWLDYKLTDNYFTNDANERSTNKSIYRRECGDSEGKHDQKCYLRRYGQFIMIAKSKVWKIGLDSKRKKDILELRYDPKIVNVVCTECSGAKVALHFTDYVPCDGTYATLTSQIISQVDVNVAIQLLLMNTSKAASADECAYLLSRFKTRLHRAMFCEKKIPKT
ncbi:hypothetical protein Ciccas_007461 [Cichlidogyrus casuarinus]|uniref:Uncharacterized protein n=1 Tax=Cichlidogyrus casuarinus TaxID=1844966 RepID=A0ABD2Q475_9PLAT